MMAYYIMCVCVSVFVHYVIKKTKATPEHIHNIYLAAMVP